MLSIVIAFFLFVIPLLVCPGWHDGIRAPKEFFSILAFLAIISVAIYNHNLRPFRNKWLLFFLLWCFVSTLFTTYLIPIYTPNAVISMPAVFFAWKELFYITLSVITIYVISSSEKLTTNEFSLFGLRITHKDVDLNITIFRVIPYIVILMSLYSLVQAIGLDEFFRTCDPATNWIAGNPITGAKDTVGSTSRRIVGTLGNPAILGVWFTLCLPICLYLKSKLGYIAFVLALVVIALTHSSTAITGAVVAITIYTFFVNKRLAVAIFLSSIIALSLLFYIPKSQNYIKHFYNPKGRVEIHKETFKLLFEKSITGFGLGTFEHIIGNNPDITRKLAGENWRELHDEYGQIWFTTGLIGLILFLGFVFSSIWNFLTNFTIEKACVFASLVAFLVMSISYFTMRISPISFYGVILTGLLLRGDKK